MEQVRPATGSNCIPETSDILVADSLFSHDSGYFSQDWPTNVQRKKLSLLCGGVNEIHHPQTIPSIEFEASNLKKGYKGGSEMCSDSVIFANEEGD